MKDGVVEACWAHNPEPARSKLPPTNSWIMLPRKTFSELQNMTSSKNYLCDSNHPICKRVTKSEKRHPVKKASDQDGAAKAFWAHNPEAGRSKLPLADSYILFCRKTFFEIERSDIIKKLLLRGLQPSDSHIRHKKRTKHKTKGQTELEKNSGAVKRCW